MDTSNIIYGELVIQTNYITRFIKQLAVTSINLQPLLYMTRHSSILTGSRIAAVEWYLHVLAQM